MKSSPTPADVWQRDFLREQRLPDSYLDTARVYFDPLAAQLAELAATRPQTLVIGKDGVVESTHIGFVGKDALRQRLKDELDVLALGGKIASAQNESASSDGQEAKEDRGEEQP